MNTMIVETDPVTIVRRYLEALQEGVVGDELAAFFAEDAIQEELPNRLNPHGGKSDLAIFIELRDGRIFRQRNYDCFEPWQEG